MKLLVPYMLMAVVFAACRPNEEFPAVHEFSIDDPAYSGKVRFEKLTSTRGFKVLLESDSGQTDQTFFRYTPYRFDTADVNHDGKTEVIVGLIKSTRFDPTEKKRLFILRIDNNHLRPLWLGSKVCQELIDFKALNNGQIQTLERTASGTYAIGRYYWQSFGLTLDQYLHDELSLNHANKIFRR